MNEKKTTKNLGKRDQKRLRLSPHTSDMAAAIARQVGVPENTVHNFALAMLAAQFSPHLQAHGLSLDILGEEVRSLIEDAKRVVNTRPGAPTKASK